MAEEILRLGRRHGDADGCVVCHGGDPAASEVGRAHAGAPRTLAEEGGPDAFHPDPGAGAVAARACGQCHEGYAERWRKSVMSTHSESIERDLCAPAWKKRQALGGVGERFGRYAITDEDGPEPVAGSSVYRSLTRLLAARRPEHFPGSLRGLPHGAAIDLGEGAPERCRACHGDAPGSGPHADGRVGCSSCHVRRGPYRGSDPTVDRGRNDGILFHRIQGTGIARLESEGGSEETWAGVSAQSCFDCHFNPLLASVNEIGDAFVHYGRHLQESRPGLLCQDCHTSIEMHGDGNIAAVSSAQSEVRCEDCHGTPDRFPWELPLGHGNPDDLASDSLPPRGVAAEDAMAEGRHGAPSGGPILTSRGNPFGNVVRQGDRVLLHSATGEIHAVTLLKSLGKTVSWRSELSRQVKSQPAAHQGMACSDCHADWLPPCLGCHVEGPD